MWFSNDTSHFPLLYENDSQETINNNIWNHVLGNAWPLPTQGLAKGNGGLKP